MSEPTIGQQALGAFLRNLRGDTWDDVNVTQKALGDAIGASTALISSWEASGAIPPEDRLRQYARFFCTHRSVEGKPFRLLPADDLVQAEEDERGLLLDKLVRLREDAQERPAPQRLRGGLGGSFWYFPEGQPLMIVCTPMTRNQLLGRTGAQLDETATSAQQYAMNPSHPNWIQNHSNADIDSLLELVGHVRAENSGLDVQWQTTDRPLANDDLTGNMVILGGGDPDLDSWGTVGVLQYFFEELDLPLDVISDDDDPEFGLQFVVLQDEDGNPVRNGTRREPYGPRFKRDESTPDRPRLIRNGAPLLEHDVALIARAPNPLNESTRITLCIGLFSRGTYGAVRAFTDAQLRTRNENWLAGSSMNPDKFWMLVQIPVFGGVRTITPDLARPIHRLRTS